MRKRVKGNYVCICSSWSRQQERGVGVVWQTYTFTGSFRWWNFTSTRKVKKLKLSRQQPGTAEKCKLHLTPYTWSSPTLRFHLHAALKVFLGHHQIVSADSVPSTIYTAEFFQTSDKVVMAQELPGSREAWVLSQSRWLWQGRRGEQVAAGHEEG